MKYFLFLSLKSRLIIFFYGISKYTLAISMATRLIQQKAKNQHIHFSVSVREVFKTFDTSITQVEITLDFLFISYNQHFFTDQLWTSAHFSEPYVMKRFWWLKSKSSTMFGANGCLATINILICAKMQENSKWL